MQHINLLWKFLTKENFNKSHLIKLHKDYTKEPFSFLVNDTTLSSDNPLQFRKNC